MMKISANNFRNLMATLALATLLASTPFQFALAPSDQETEVNHRTNGVLFYDFITQEDVQCGVARPIGLGFPADPGLVYVVGDSIANGARNEIVDAIGAGGGEWSASVNAEDGRPLNNNTIPAVFSGATDEGSTEGDFQRASAIVMALGTNNNFGANTQAEMESRISATVTAIRERNSSANIYWVDVAAKREDIASAMSGVNNAIYSQAPNNYQVIPWFQTVYGDGYNPRSVDPELENVNGYLSDDNVHPTPEGEAALAQVIADMVVGVESGPATRDDAVVTGENNVEYAYNYLIGRFGLPPHQAAGIVGNLIHESGVDPVRAEGGGYQTISSMDEVTPGRGFGIAQWTTAGRQDSWRDFANDRNADPLSLDLQLEFLWWEISEASPGFYGYEEFLAAPDIRSATWIFLSRFERPASVIDDPQFGGRNNYRPSVAPPSTGPASETLDTRDEAAQSVVRDYGEGSFLLACGSAEGGVGEPDFSANPNIAVDSSPPGAHRDSNCTGGFTVGAQALSTYVMGRWSPPVTSVGGYSCRAILFDNSRPTSIHGMGRALDIMVDGTTPEGLATGNEIRNYLINNAEALGIQRVIWNRFTWAANQDGWRPFISADENPHTDHLHVEINIEASGNPDLI